MQHGPYLTTAELSLRCGHCVRACRKTMQSEHSHATIAGCAELRPVKRQALQNLLFTIHDVYCWLLKAAHDAIGARPGDCLPAPVKMRAKSSQP